MPDFGAIASLLGNVKSVFDFVAGTTGSVSGFNDPDGGPAMLFETLFSGSAGD